MAGTATGGHFDHGAPDPDDGQDHDDGHGPADPGGWVLVVLAAAVVAFLLAGVLIRAVGADDAPVAAPSADIEHRVAAPTTSAVPATTAPADAAVPSTTEVAAEAPTTAAPAPEDAPTTSEAAGAAGGASRPAPNTPEPEPATPSARPGGDGADAAESAAAVTFARLVRQHCDLAGVPDPGQVRSTALGESLFRIVDANGIVLQLDVSTGVVSSADSLDGTVPGGYSASCRPALFGG